MSCHVEHGATLSGHVPGSNSANWQWREIGERRLKLRLSPRTCPHCGRPPEDFADEETVVEDRPREAGLQLVK